MWWLAFASNSDKPGADLPPPDTPEGKTGGAAPAERADEPLAAATSPGQSPSADDLYAGDADEARNVVLKLLPWTSSLLLHVAVVLLAIFAIWSVQVEVEEEQLIIPDVRLSKLPGTPLKVTSKQQSSQTSARRNVRSVNSERASAATTPTESPTQLIGALGGDAGSNANPFAAELNAGSGLEANVFGVGGNAYRVVYVIDASGSLVDSLYYVIKELKRSINDLSEQQKFTVIFFQGDKAPLEVPPPGLRPATAEYKQRVIKWIDLSEGNVVPQSGTNPMKAIKLALRYNPQLIIMLSDNITGRGIYEVDQRQLLTAINKANKSKTAISTIQFMYPDPLVEIGMEATMELIAKQNGGKYRFVNARELGVE